jgi:urea transporter
MVTKIGLVVATNALVITTSLMFVTNVALVVTTSATFVTTDAILVVNVRRVVAIASPFVINRWILVRYAGANGTLRGDTSDILRSTNSALGNE